MSLSFLPLSVLPINWERSRYRLFRRISQSSKKHSTASSKVTRCSKSLSRSKSYSKSRGVKRCQSTNLHSTAVIRRAGRHRLVRRPPLRSRPAGYGIHRLLPVSWLTGVAALILAPQDHLIESSSSLCGEQLSRERSTPPQGRGCHQPNPPPSFRPLSSPPGRAAYPPCCNGRAQS